MFRDPVSQKDGPERSTVYKKMRWWWGEEEEEEEEVATPLAPLNLK